MRVALVSGYDWDASGGVRTQVEGLAAEFARRGEEVVVVAPGARTLGGERPDGVRLVTVGQSIGVPSNGSVAPVAPTPQAAARTLRSLWSLRPDVTHLHEPFVPGPPVAALVLGPRPLVATFHRAGSDAAYRFAGRLLGGVARRRLSAAAAVSPAAAETVATAFGRGALPLLEVPNGVDLQRFSQAAGAVAAEVAARRARYRGGDVPRIVFLGRHEPRKGAAVLVEAVAALEIELELVVAGGGPETAELRRAAAGDPRITFPGPAADSAVPGLLAGADLFVTPALSGESFGLVLLEAMAAGTPVVASSIPGYVSAAGGAARLVPPGDAVALRRAIAELLSNDAARSRLEALGRERAGECSVASTAARYLELYREVRRGSGAPRRGAPAGRRLGG